jgi:GlcNAc-P-P-Und epimerase
MFTRVVIFGGAGYIGSHLARRLLDGGLSKQVVVADINPSPLEGMPGLVCKKVDVRKPLSLDLCDGPVDWIFNFAAVHREPGHQPHEYFDTNINGAETVTAYADAINCKNIYFTSSISVYGPTSGPTDESAKMCPISPYGGSKYPAELIHRGWQRLEPSLRRLIIVRPGVVYGPNDPGNIGRMVSAVRGGYFAFPGSIDVKKSYAYIYGMLDSIEFLLKRPESVITYNYVETPTEPLGALVGAVKKFVGSKAPILSIPTALLLPVASFVQLIAGDRNPVHPVRVRKAGMSTHIVPQTLLSMGFDFKYTFESSLQHWAKVSPADFGRK